MHILATQIRTCNLPPRKDSTAANSLYTPSRNYSNTHDNLINVFLRGRTLQTVFAHNHSANHLDYLDRFGLETTLDRQLTFGLI